MMAPSPDWISGIKVPVNILGAQASTYYLLLATYYLLIATYYYLLLLLGRRHVRGWLLESL